MRGPRRTEGHVLSGQPRPHPQHRERHLSHSSTRPKPEGQVGEEAEGEVEEEEGSQANGCTSTQGAAGADIAHRQPKGRVRCQTFPRRLSLEQALWRSPSSAPMQQLMRLAQPCRMSGVNARGSQRGAHSRWRERGERITLWLKSGRQASRQPTKGAVADWSMKAASIKAEPMTATEGR